MPLDRRRPAMAPGNPGSDRQRILHSYRLYLARERGLADGTITNYLQCAGVFLEHLADPLDVTLGDLSAGPGPGFLQRLRAGGGPAPRSLAGAPRAPLVGVPAPALPCPARVQCSPARRVMP